MSIYSPFSGAISEWNRSSKWSFLVSYYYILSIFLKYSHLMTCAKFKFFYRYISGKYTKIAPKFGDEPLKEVLACTKSWLLWWLHVINILTTKWISVSFNNLRSSCRDEMVLMKFNVDVFIHQLDIKTSEVNKHPEYTRAKSMCFLGWAGIWGHKKNFAWLT